MTTVSTACDTTAPNPYPDLVDFLNAGTGGYDWLIPGLLERRDRLIVTGEEGHGKTTLLRQIAVRAAAGMNPFTADTFPPIRVLLLDLENGERLVHRELTKLHQAVGGALPRYHLTPIQEPAGIDLFSTYDFEWLQGRIGQIQPDIVIAGPMYKMASGDAIGEQDARRLAAILDRLRFTFDVALILEAHPPYAANAATKRSTRPYGASLWSRWPEFGIHLGKTGKLQHWREPRDQRLWPTALRRGDGSWPWVTASAADELWMQIEDAMRSAGRKLSERELEARLGVSRGRVQRTINARKAEHAALVVELDGSVAHSAAGSRASSSNLTFTLRASSAGGQP